MLEFLQTGKMLYVLAAVCALGTLSKLVTGSLYKRLIRETGNMALTKDKNLKALKQRMENVFLINHGIRNVSAYIEKQLYGFRFLHVTLDGWDNLSVQAMILCFMAGGAAAFGAYWYRCDSYYIVSYGAAGVFGGLFLAFVDNGVDAAAKRKQLADNLVDYVENSPHFYRNADNAAYSGQERKKAAGASDIVDLSGNAGYARMPESVRKEKMSGRFSVLGRKKDVQEADGKSESGRQEAASLIGSVRTRSAGRAARLDGKGLTGLANKENDAAGEKNGGDSMGGLGRRAVGKMDEPRAQTVNARSGGRGSAGAQDKENDPDRTDFREVRTSEADLAESITHLSESLRQIAASREQASMQQKDADCLELIQNSVSAEDMKVLKTLLHAFQNSGT